MEYYNGGYSLRRKGNRVYLPNEILSRIKKRNPSYLEHNNSLVFMVIQFDLYPGRQVPCFLDYHFMEENSIRHSEDVLYRELRSQRSASSLVLEAKLENRLLSIPKPFLELLESEKLYWLGSKHSFQICHRSDVVNLHRMADQFKPEFERLERLLFWKKKHPSRRKITQSDYHYPTL